MPEDVKKIIVLCFLVSGSKDLFEEAKAKKLPTLERFLREGTWAKALIPASSSGARWASLLTAASPETHGVNRAGDISRAEYIWQAVQRSSKKTALFGLLIDRPPESSHPADDPSAISSYLRTSPDWDLCFVFLPGQSDEKSLSSEMIEHAASKILTTVDPETLFIVVGITDPGNNSFIALSGPGVRKGIFIKRKVRLEDVIPTLCYLGELSVPADCEGGIIHQALEDPDMKIKELRACRRNYERLRRSNGPSAMC